MAEPTDVEGSEVRTGKLYGSDDWEVQSVLIPKSVSVWLGTQPARVEHWDCVHRWDRVHQRSWLPSIQENESRRSCPHEDIWKNGRVGGRSDQAGTSPIEMRS